jgi:glutamate racemase
VATQLRRGRVGVLATPATAASGAYGRALRAVDPSCHVVEIGCPAFVPLIEAGNFRDPRLRAAAMAYLEPLLAERVEAIVLGCTHYPLLEELLRDLLPPDVVLVDPAQAAVDQLGHRLGKTPTRQARSCGLHPRVVPVERGRFCVTGDAEAFSLAAAPWLGWQPQVERVCLRSSLRAF